MQIAEVLNCDKSVYQKTIESFLTFDNLSQHLGARLRPVLQSAYELGANRKIRESC